MGCCERDAMDSYIVRIYRRGGGKDEGPQVVGLVEDPNASCQRPFTCFDELRSILSFEDGICRRKESRDVGLFRRKSDKPSVS